MEKKNWISVSRDSLVTLCQAMFKDGNDIEIRCTDLNDISVGFCKNETHSGTPYDMIVKVKSDSFANVMKILFAANVNDVRVIDWQDDVAIVCWNLPKEETERGDVKTPKNNEPKDEYVNNTTHDESKQVNNDGKTEKSEQDMMNEIDSELESLIKALFPGSDVKVKHFINKDEVKKIREEMRRERQEEIPSFFDFMRLISDMFK